MQRIGSAKINGTDYYGKLPTPDTDDGRQALLEACKGQLNEFKISVPYSESGYTIEAKRKDLDESDAEYMRVGNFLWYYNAEECRNPDDFINHGKIELIQVEYNGTTYLQEDLQNPGTVFDWDDGEGDGVGAAVLPAGAVITAKIVPEYGYQLSLFGVNNANFGTGDEQSVFTFEVARGNFHLCANITSVEDKVENNTEAVTDGSIQLGDGEIDTGSVVLSVETAGDENKSDFESELANDEEISGYKIESILDINLNQVLYKGNETDYWENPLNDLSSEAEISLDLADNFNNVVVLHQNHDGSFEILPTTFEDGKITFKTDSFSEFALAVEKTSIEQVATPNISPNGGTFSGSQTVTITCATKDATIYYTTDGSVPTTGSTKYTGALTISTTTTVKAIAVKDGMNDSAAATAVFAKEYSGGGTPAYPAYPSYPSNPTNPSQPVNPVTTQNPVEPKIKGENGKNGWDAITNEIKASVDGDKIVIDMNGATELPKDILKSIKGKEVDIVLDMGNGITWTINGKNVKNPRNIDFSISNDTKIPAKVINKVIGENSYVTISLKHNGSLGFKAVLSIDLEKKNKDLYANLYYYNTKTKKTEFVGSDKINSEGKADFAFTHASDYIIIIDKVNHAKPVVKATSTANSVRLSWKAVPEAEKYAIYKYRNGKAVKLTETEKLAVNIRKLRSDTEYKYIVRAYVDGKWTTMLKSDIVTVKTKAE